MEKIQHDLEEYLLRKSNDYHTKQVILGWKQAFRGYVVRIWTNECDDENFNYEINKLIIKQCADYYVECWHDRNKKFHNPEKKKEYLIEWLKILDEMIRNSNKEEAVKCLQYYEIDINNASISLLQQRNQHLMEVFKKSKEKNNNKDIRQFLIMKE